MNRKKISELSDDILNSFKDWFGPSGKCWCDKIKKHVTPGKCPENCPECTLLRDDRQRSFYRYLRLHDSNKFD